MRWSDQDKPVLVEDYPREREGGGYDTKFDVILMNIEGSAPPPVASAASRIGGTGTGRAIGFKSVIEEHPEKNGYRLVKRMWAEELIVQFLIHSKSNRRANELAAWFHRTLILYAHSMQFFRSRGINWFRFHQRLADAKTKEYGQELYLRPLQYALRLELIDTAEIKTLDSIELTVAPVI